MTKTIALVAVVVVASAAGMNAYLMYQPNALEAQAVDVTAANVPVTGTSGSAACQSEIATAAARGTPDTESVVTDANDLQFEDHCVAAILNPAVTTLGPNNPGSYMCVGKSAKVTVDVSGVVTETAVPDPAVPAGTCTAVACSPANGSGVSNCIAANNLTSISSNSITSDLAEAGNSTVTSDTGITSFSMNADGSIVPESGNTVQVLDSAAGDQSALQNSVSISSDAPNTDAVSGTASDNSSAFVNTTATAPNASAAPTTDVSGMEVTGGAQPATPVESSPVAPADVATTPTTATTQTINMNNIVFQDPDAAVEPTSPTIPSADSPSANFESSVNTGASVASNGSGSSGNWFTNIATDITSGVNNIKAYFGFPSDETSPGSIPATIGIRG